MGGGEDSGGLCKAIKIVLAEQLKLLAVIQRHLLVKVHVKEKHIMHVIT